MERDPIAEVNIMPVEGHDSEWLVEAIDSDGGVHRATFQGKHAQGDARLWAASAYPGKPALVFGPMTYLPDRKRPTLTVVGGSEA